MIMDTAPKNLADTTPEELEEFRAGRDSNARVACIFLLEGDAENALHFAKKYRVEEEKVKAVIVAWNERMVKRA